MGRAKKEVPQEIPISVVRSLKQRHPTWTFDKCIVCDEWCVVIAKEARHPTCEIPAPKKKRRKKNEVDPNQSSFGIEEGN